MPARLPARRRPIDYRVLADLRYQLRRFLRTREVTARAAGIEPQQYLLLLQVRGLAGRREATIGALAERLQISHHGVVQLVDRLVERGLVERRRGADRRAGVVRLRRPGETILQKLARQSIPGLTTQGPGPGAPPGRLTGPATPNGEAPRERTGKA